jgi:hypothetical protein
MLFYARTHPHLSFQSVLLACIAAFLAAGCGAVTLAPDYQNHALHRPDLKRDKLTIVQVIDQRPDTSSQIGTARVGLFNQVVPYNLDGSVAGVIQRMLDTLFVIPGGDSANAIPVSVAIRSLQVGENYSLFNEEAYFMGGLRFSYPVGPDSINALSFFSRQTTTNWFDVTNDIQDVLYSGIADCASQFITSMYDKAPGQAISRDSTKLFVTEASRIPPNNVVRLDSGTTHVNLGESNFNFEADPHRNELSLQYFQGKYITTGIRGSYCMFTQASDTNLMWGSSFTFAYMAVTNNDKGTQGSFVNFGGRYGLKNYFSSAPTTAYFSANLGLLAGTENFNTGGGGQEQSFFFGGIFDESIGLSLNRKASLEIGFFQVAIAGSHLLSSDVGVTGGISFGL